MSIAIDEPRAEPAETPEPPPREQVWLNEQTRTVCLVVIAVVATGAAMAYLKGILTPLLVALFFFYLILPATDVLRRASIPRWLTGPAFFVVLVLLIGLVWQMLYGSVEGLMARTPRYREKVGQLLAPAMHKFGIGHAAAADAGLDDLIQQAWKDTLHWLAHQALGVVELTLLVVFYLLFLFIEARTLPRRVEEAFDPDTADETHKLGRDITRKVKRYLLYKTYINLGLAATTGLICYLMGLPFWALWAVLMFLLNYVTYVGSIIALVPPVALAILEFDSLWAGLGLATLLTLNRLVWIDYIEIRSLGNVLNISPVVLLLTIAFFGYIWGPVGLLLAVPLITTAKIILSDFEQTRHLAVLISEEGEAA